MPRRGPFVDIEKKDHQILNHLKLNEGIGFNQLWRKLKKDEIGMSYSTLSKVLKRLKDGEYVDIDVKTTVQKIPRHSYYKTKSGRVYEQHLGDKIRSSSFPAKKIIKAHKSNLKLNQAIIGEMPYTCEIELSSHDLTHEKEEEISKLIETFSDILIPNIAESLNKAYSGSLSLLTKGSIEDSKNYLKKALSFNLRLSIIFDGYNIAINKNWQDKLEKELADLYSARAIFDPTEMELIYCWLNGILGQILYPNNFDYDLTDLDGWAKLITNFSNEWRKERDIPLLDEEKVKEFLKEQMRKGFISFKATKLNTNILQFHRKFPEMHVDESYSFLLGLISSLKSMTENVS